MSRITINVTGDFKNTERLLSSIKSRSYAKHLKYYGQRGVEALASATPRDTGKTADSWSYNITQTKSGYKINYINTNTVKGNNIAILIQYGHGTGTGGYVEGLDYINPAIAPVFEQMANDITKELSQG